MSDHNKDRENVDQKYHLETSQLNSSFFQVREVLSPTGFVMDFLVAKRVVSSMVVDGQKIYKVSSSDNNNGAGGKRPPQSTLLADRIAAMGLGYGKAEATTKQLRGNNKNAVADGQELVHADDDDNDNFIDADHDGTTQLPNNKEASTTTTTTAVSSSSISENMVQYADHSSQTGLRFVLNSRTRTVMGLLEKMFET